jgi:hypothetical protein
LPVFSISHSYGRLEKYITYNAEAFINFECEPIHMFRGCDGQLSKDCFGFSMLWIVVECTANGSLFFVGGRFSNAATFMRL